MNISKKLLSLLFFLPIVSCLIPVAHAQQTPLNLTAYPSTFSITVKPGSTTQERFRLRNNADGDISLSVSLKKLTSDSHGNVTIEDFTKNDTYQNWIAFEKTPVVALSREWVDVNFTITVPSESAFGYYYVIYITPTSQNTATHAAQTTLTGSLAIPLLLTVDKPGATIDGKMLSFTNPSSFSEYLPVAFNTTFINTGNIHIHPTGNIFIKDWTGRLVDTLVINDIQSSILPNGKRTYITPWNNSFITEEPITQDGTTMRDSNGNTKTHLVFHFDHILNLRIGKYTATALTVIPTEKRDISFESTTTFWIFPWKVVGLSLIFVILAGVGLWNTLYGIWHHGKRIFKKEKTI